MLIFIYFKNKYVNFDANKNKQIIQLNDFGYGYYNY
jgi:hypothetical protein